MKSEAEGIGSEILFSGPVPSNASRFFESRGAAIEQEPGRIEIAYSPQGFLFNSAFRPELIALDENYMTQVADLKFSTVIPTLGYFKEACDGLLESGDTIVDIGCGQGEFVSALRTEGFDAHGFDPVLRMPSPFLHPHFWEPGLIEAKLFVMRCVLPHIHDPWNFLESVFEKHPDAYFLIEYQRIEWAIENGIWYQLNHDHVNLFRLSDFHEKFEVVSEGTFSSGEWQYVVLGSSVGSPRANTPPPAHSPKLALNPYRSADKIPSIL